jgi:fructose-1,6-bisphosphatase/inositol monophosphatase family enzyme
MQRKKEFAVNLALQAGKLIKTNFMLGMQKKWKSDNTPLTETDLAINQMVINAVKKEFPGYGVIAEEKSDFSNQEFVWVCDPVDGTTAFSHGIPVCVFSLALVHNGESILGVIYDPFMKRMFFAEKGKGAFLNKKRIHVSSSNSIEASVFGIFDWKNSQFNFSKLQEVLKNKGAKILRIGSITYSAALVACGEFAGTIFAGTKPHDSAALKLIIEEAGGKVTDIFGNEQRYDRDIKGHLATNGILHPKLMELIPKNIF